MTQTLSGGRTTNGQPSAGQGREGAPANATNGAGGGNGVAAALGAAVAGSQTVSIPLVLNVSVSLGAAQAAVAATAKGPASDESVLLEKLTEPFIDPDYSTRKGYDETFLGAPVPMPDVKKSIASAMDDGEIQIPYQHFSVVINKKRRLAAVVAWNVDGTAPARKPEAGDYTRKGLTGLGKSDQEKWKTDPRVPEAHQLPDKFYTKDRSAFDKGHIARREDVCWGASYAEVKRANGDTFHTTNCSPQVAGFNRSPGEWGSLENYVLQQAEAKDGQRYTLFAGPIFAADDETFEGSDDRGPVKIQIPKAFWKMVITRDKNDTLQAYAFKLSQDLSDVQFKEEFTVAADWKHSLISVQDLEGLLDGVIFAAVVKQADQADTENGHEMLKTVPGLTRHGDAAVVVAVDSSN